MKIGFQGRFLNKPFTGIGQYCNGLLEEFQKQDEMELVVARLERDGHLRRHYFEQHTAPKKFLKEKVDLIHFPYPSHPWRVMPVPTIVTVHDVIPWIFPEYRLGILSSLAHAKAKSALHFATHIITVSEFSKQEIMRVTGVPHEKISVIYNGCSPVFSQQADPEALKRFSLQSKKYFIYAGGYDPRKNVQALLGTFEAFLLKHPDAKLVLVGEPNLTFKNRGLTMKSRDKIVCTGFVDTGILAALYQHAAAFIHLSAYEGFNIPLLEAATSGSPLILSGIPVHREIAKTNAFFVDLNDPVEIVKTMENTWNNPPPPSRELARHYSWQKSAAQHISIYKSLCQPRRSSSSSSSFSPEYSERRC